MDIDLNRVSAFMTANARLLDRRRFDLITGRGEADGVLGALAAYRNDDGGFGWALEPDLRSPESQPVGALHAFEVLEEVAEYGGAAPGPTAVRLCDWLDSVTLPDGGVPFALPVGEPTGTAPWWRQAGTEHSSLHLTCAVAGAAHLLGRYDAAVREHRWLERATGYCMARIAAAERPAGSYELRYVLSFLDAVHDVVPEAPGELRRMVGLLPDDGLLPVAGGADGEALHPLDYAPRPGTPLRGLLPGEVIEADLDRLASRQDDDGGWTVDFVSASTAGALEWRGHATVAAVKILLAHGADGRTEIG
ncbi:hypothetical protein [Thermostaphylospora chromogena]|uniref:Prenyltransferase n=1 Tax=Thermostaphylospora chromogena TaxID=35622 RepID=A0A1H1D1J9_9ACTN|nr:hypothetical protein [Thermostaphylospora chromogena]SDQ70353.1 hypothetical protein SAMN04489764_1773 [Thermostaphylospora chromogena]